LPQGLFTTDPHHGFSAVPVSNDALKFSRVGEASEQQQQSAGRKDFPHFVTFALRTRRV